MTQHVPTELPGVPCLYRSGYRVTHAYRKTPDLLLSCKGCSIYTVPIQMEPKFCLRAAHLAQISK